MKKYVLLMKKLQKELESVVGMDHTVEESHLDKLQYLDCVVKEAFRLHPVVPLLLPHESIEDCVVDGFHIPKKSRIMVNVWAIGRDPNVWHDPLSFTPERFMGSNIDVKGHNFQLLPFSSGRRGCPGMQLGLTVVKLVVAQLVHCFQWELPQGRLIFFPIFRLVFVGFAVLLLNSNVNYSDFWHCGDENIQVKDGVVVFSKGDMGTNRWMAPKMIKDKPCTRKVDVYSLKVNVV
ncbi:hypothetical protein ACS0TY_025475 [Phlomoides rotata]